MPGRTTAWGHCNGNGHNQHSPLAALALTLPPRVLRRLAKSLKKQWRRYRKELKHCQKDFSEEAVHGSRIASRRLLATIELLAGFLPPRRVKKIRRALKEYLDSFDEVRDTHVQLAAVDKLRRRFSGARVFYQFLCRREERFTRQTRKRIQRIQSRGLGKWIRASRKDCIRQQQVLGPAAAPTLVLRAVDQAFRRTCELRAQIDPQNSQTIHRTRVAFKKFRYMVEELGEFVMSPRQLAGLHHYQTLMGAIQDVEVLLRVLNHFLATQALAPEPARALREQLQHQRQELVQHYLAEADRLFDFWPAAAAVAPRPARGATQAASRPAPAGRSPKAAASGRRVQPKGKAR